MAHEKKSTQRFIEPYPQFGTGGENNTVAFRDDDHTPYTKLAHEFLASWAQVSFTKSIVGKWVEVRAEETTTSKKGNTQTRVITLVLPAADFKKMVSFTTEGL